MSWLGEAGARWNVTGHRWLSGHLPLASFVPDSSQEALALALSCSMRHPWGSWGNEITGMASLSLAKAQAFFLYLAPPVPKGYSQVSNSRILGFPLPSPELFMAGR